MITTQGREVSYPRNIESLVLGLREWIFELFLLNKTAITQLKMTAMAKKMKLVLKTIHKKAFLKKQINPTFPSFR